MLSTRKSKICQDAAQDYLLVVVDKDINWGQVRYYLMKIMKLMMHI